MRAKDVKDFLQYVYNYFPLPDDFGGAHGLIFKEKKIHLLLWFEFNGEMLNRIVTFDDGEKLNKQTIVQIKKTIDKISHGAAMEKALSKLAEIAKARREHSAALEVEEEPVMPVVEVQEEIKEQESCDPASL